MVLAGGDEIVALWERNADAAGYDTRYVFAGEQFEEFPTAHFWSATLLHNMARRLLGTTTNEPGPALALAFPRSCTRVLMLPWEKVLLR